MDRLDKLAEIDTPALRHGRLQGKPDWSGVVCVERPDPAEMCKVYSARTTTFNGRRAIVCQLPWKQVKHYFTDPNMPEVYVYAEFRAATTYLQLYEHASHREFFTTADGGLPALPNH